MAELAGKNASRWTLGLAPSAFRDSQLGVGPGVAQAHKDLWRDNFVKANTARLERAGQDGNEQAFSAPEIPT